MEYIRIYAGGDGESHFGDVMVDVSPEQFAPLINVSMPLEAERVLFAMFEAGWHGEAHPAPREARQRW